MTTITLGNTLTLEEIAALAGGEVQIQLSPEARKRIQKSHQFLHQFLSKSKKPVYGINTGFGSLYSKEIDENQLHTLQNNLLVSHACGSGELATDEVVRLMLAFKIQSFSYGHSGVSEQLVDKLIELYNHNLLPQVFCQGSLGASGDLAPLAHMSLPLIGMGQIKVNGQFTAVVPEICKPVGLGPKEGLALINGTQFMSATLAVCVLKAKKIADWADTIGALSVDAFDGRTEPFYEGLHAIRPHKGQAKTAANIRYLLKGSEIAAQSKQHVQDPYSFRCIPQVHGAGKDVIETVTQVLLTEVNAVTDNPTIFPQEELIISGGNFHGQTLALHADFLCIAISEFGNISERRTYQLISGSRGLPAFLVKNPGLNSGLMIPQYTAASIVNRNKILCMPASADSITSSNGQEDHVSMGANSVVKCLEVCDNTFQILGIEAINASQALAFRNASTSPVLNKVLADFRKAVPVIENDCLMQPLILNSRLFLENKETPL